MLSAIVRNYLLLDDDEIDSNSYFEADIFERNDEDEAGTQVEEGADHYTNWVEQLRGFDKSEGSQMLGC